MLLSTPIFRRSPCHSHHHQRAGPRWTCLAVPKGKRVLVAPRGVSPALQKAASGPQAAAVRTNHGVSALLATVCPCCYAGPGDCTHVRNCRALEGSTFSSNLSRNQSFHYLKPFASMKMLFHEDISATLMLPSGSPCQCANGEAGTQTTSWKVRIRTQLSVISRLR